jgi:hypothetical protein
VINHVWTVLCTKVLYDADNVVTLCDVVERIVIRSPEDMQAQVDEQKRQGRLGIAAEVRIAIASWWVLSDYGVAEKSLERAVLIDPQGERINTWQMAFGIEPPNTGARTVINITKLPLNAAGRYTIVLEQEVESNRWVSVATLPLGVEFETVSANDPTLPAPPPTAAQ